MNPTQLATGEIFRKIDRNFDKRVADVVGGIAKSLVDSRDSSALRASSASSLCTLLPSLTRVIPCNVSGRSTHGNCRCCIQLCFARSHSTLEYSHPLLTKDTLHCVRASSP